MGNFIDITDQRYGRLTVVSLWGFRHSLWRDRNGKRHESSASRWHVECDCGQKRIVFSKNLRQGRSKSCGCYQKEVAAKQLKDLKYNKGEKCLDSKHQ